MNRETIEAILDKDPKDGFDMLFEDLCRRLRQQGVSEYSIEGIQIVMMLAFQLGEAHASRAREGRTQ